MSRKTISLIFMVLCLAPAGCISFEPRPDPSRFFALTSLPRTSQVAENAAASNDVALGVGPVKIPGYLDRDQLVTRISENRFAIAENDRWAESLEENLSRVLSENLSILVQTDRIVAYPWDRAQRPTYQLQVEVLRFEPKQEQRVEFWARWMILDETRKIVLSKESHLNRAAKDRSIEAAVAALSETVADLSREIADALRTLPRGGTADKTAKG